MQRHHPDSPLFPLAFRGFIACAIVVMSTGACAFFGGETNASSSFAVYRGSGEGSAPAYVLEGGNADLLLWTAGGRLDQLVVRTHDGEIDTRVIVDPADGAPRVVIDEVTGNYGLFQQASDERYDLLIFDADNVWVDGATLRRNGARWERARILGLPAFAGQIRGNLSESEAGSGSFAVIADEADTLADIVDVTEEMDAITTMLSTASGGQALFGPIGETLRVGGALVLVGALIPPVAHAYAAAGVAMTIVGFFTNDIATGIEERFASDVPLANELRDVAVSWLREPGRRGPIETLRDIVDGVKAFAADPLGAVGGELEWPTLEDAPWSGDDPGRLDVGDAPVGGTPPTLPVDVSGQAVWQDNSVDTVTGSVDADGTVTLESDDGALTIEGAVEGTDVQGTWTTPDESGTVDGTVEQIGSCEAVQASGGQGTFSNVHFVGVGSGDVSFTYDAYDVPDAFTVAVGGATRFTTGGLVSGSSTTPIAMNGERFVFVSVSAPESGTAWDYALSCL